jgi:hypothetical protein
MGYYSVIKQIVALSLMIIFGLWAIKNVRHIRRIGVATNLSVSRAVEETNSHSTSSKDRQLVVYSVLRMQHFLCIK